MSPFGGRPKAIGYLRREVSGIRRKRHELEIRCLAKTLGYDLARTLTLGSEIDDPVQTLLEVVRKLGAAAVITPALEHIDQHPGTVCGTCELVTVSPEQVFARSTPGEQ